MNIQNLRRTPGAGSLVATFDLQATPEITLNDWQLRRTPKGFRAYPPAPRNGRPAVLVEPSTFSTIGRMAADAFTEGNAHDATHNAA